MDSPATTSTREQILDAAVESVSLFGMAKLSMSDVATRARISRPTLYKYFSSREDLVAAAVAREAEVLVSQVVGAAAVHDDASDALRAAIVAALELTRAHPLLDRIIRTEPESLLPYLTTDRIDGDGGAGGSAVLLFVRSATEAVVADRLAGELDALTIRRLADMVARLLVSYAISAPDDPPEVVAAVVADVLVNGALVAGSGAGSAMATENTKTTTQEQP